MIEIYSKKLTKIYSLVCLILFVGFGVSVNAQAPSRYALSVSSGTYTPLAVANGATSLPALVGDDVFSNITGLPGFTIDGVTYTNFQPNSNGRLSLYGATAPTATGTYTPLSTAITNAGAVLAVFGRDLNGTAALGTEFLYQVIGNELVFEWKNYTRFAVANESLNFQIRLNTTTNTISYVYGTMTPGNNATYPQVGFRTNTTFPGNVNNLMLDVVGSPISCNWSNVVTGNAVASSVYFNSANASVAPTSGLTYTWTPQNTVDRVTTFQAVSAITTTGATLSWTAPTGATQYNVQYRTVGSCAWTNWSGNPVATNTVALTGLTPFTTYQIRVQSSDGTNSPIYSQIPNAAGGGNGYVAAGTFTTLNVACSGVPSPGNTLSSSATACSGTNFTLSLQNLTTGLGVTYQWQSSANGTDWTDIAGATNPTRAVSQTTATYYQCLVTCDGNTTPSNPLLVNMSPFYLCYCTSTATSTADEEILGVTLNGVSRTSTCAALPAGTTGTLNMYTDWRGQGSLTTIQQYSSYPLSLNLGSCGGNFGRSAKVYIDYNCDGDFADAGEEVYFTGAILGTVVNPTINSTTITVPANAGPLLTVSNPTQVTGMRVVYYETTLGATAYCGTPSSWGETEDFLVTLELAPPCTGVNPPGATIASTVLGCFGANVTLSVTTPTTGAGVSYQWYKDNVLIPGATLSTYSTTIDGTAVYYADVICAETSDAASSTPITVSQDVATNCYCTPAGNCTLGDLIASVTLNTLVNNSGTACNGSYVNYTTDPTLTTSLQASTTYNCIVGAGAYAQNYAVWIDYNDNGIFETSERVGYTTTPVAINSTASFPIQLSCTPPAGVHRMRVRSAWNSELAGINITPCNTQSWGETEDYLITIIAPPTCPAPGAPVAATATSFTLDFDFPLNCATATNFDIEYGPSGFTPGTGTIVTNQAAVINGQTATVTLTGLAATTSYDAYIRANCGSGDVSPWTPVGTGSTLQAPCSGTPSTPNASFLFNSSICEGESTITTVSGVTDNVLQISNQWQISTNNVDWNPIVGETLPTYQSGALTAGTYYYRYTSTCLVTSDVATSNVLTLVVNAPPVVTISAPNNGTFCGTQTLTANGASTYVWSPANLLSATTGTAVTYTGTINGNITVTGTDANGCVASSSPFAVTFTAPEPITFTASIPSFCGTGGSSVVTVASIAPYTYTFSTNSSAVLSNQTADSFEAAITETSTVLVTGVDANSGCIAQTTVQINVYPLPTANLVSDVNGVCPGTSAVITTGLSAGNFTVSCITPINSLSSPSSSAITLCENGVTTIPLSGGSLDDGNWNNIPIGFGFNYFGVNQTQVMIGTNGTIIVGGGNSNAFSFVGGFPNTANPANCIAAVARDLQLSSTGGGLGFGTGIVRYWTEGLAPNRRFIVQYENCATWYSSNGTDGRNTVEVVLSETIGTVDIYVIEASNPSATTGTFINDTRNKFIGLQDVTRTIGATAPNCSSPFQSNFWNGISNEILSPLAWRFSPPANYTTVWTAINTQGTTTIASGTNIFTQTVTPTENTTYDISYTNQLTGCSNPTGSSQITINVLGNVAPAGIIATSSSAVVCPGVNFNLGTDYTGSLNGLTFQWQVSTNGVDFSNIPNATSPTLTVSQAVASDYRLELSQCDGVREFTSVVSVAMDVPTNCYCTPVYTFGTNDGDLISNVEIVGTTLANNTGFVAGGPSYTFFTGQPNYTATLVPSTSYTLNVSTGEWGNQGYAAWIDYNDNGVFETSERIGATNGTIGNGVTNGQVNASSSFVIALACTPPAGVHRMRIRGAFATSGLLLDPCATYGYGETEDYLITIAPAPTCPNPGLLVGGTTTTTTADLSWTLDCSTATNFDFEYGPVGFTPGTGTLVENVTTTTSTTLSGLVPNSTYQVYYRANCGNGDVSGWSIPVTVTTPCAPITLVNPGAQVVCDTYTLPTLAEVTPSNNNGLALSYRTQTNGGGTVITGPITTTQTVHVYGVAGACSANQSFVVTVNNSATSTTDVIECISYTWTDNVTYTTSGTYTQTLSTIAGCDSIATLNLTINQPSTSTLNVLACQSYTLNNETYTANGTYTQTISNAAGCDSVITLNLTIGQPDAVSVTEVACDSYTWNGTTFTATGVYTQTLLNVFGCDSVVTLDLTINNTSSSSEVITQCGTYNWNGVDYTASGTYTFTATNLAGCDSTATLVLTIGNNSSTTTAATCGSFTWTNGTTYTASGTYTQVLTNVAGCDSTVTLNLTINPLPTATATDNGNGTGTLVASTGTSYQWIDCATNAPIIGATSQTYVAPINGSYAVIVTNSSNCSATSSCVVVNYLSVEENTLSFNVYPNPTTGAVNIAIDQTTANYNVTVEDMNGRLVANFGSIINGNGLYTIDLSNVITGVYFIKLRNEFEERTVRIIKQ